MGSSSSESLVGPSSSSESTRNCTLELPPTLARVAVGVVSVSEIRISSISSSSSSSSLSVNSNSSAVAAGELPVVVDCGLGSLPSAVVSDGLLGDAFCSQEDWVLASRRLLISSFCSSFYFSLILDCSSARNCFKLVLYGLAISDSVRFYSSSTV